MLRDHCISVCARVRICLFVRLLVCKCMCVYVGVRSFACVSSCVFNQLLSQLVKQSIVLIQFEIIITI